MVTVASFCEEARSASACIQYVLSLRVHLAQQIRDERLRQKFVAEVRASVEEVYGKQLPEREVLEKGYIEQVLLLRRVSRKQFVLRGVSGCLPSDRGPIDVKSGVGEGACWSYTKLRAVWIKGLLILSLTSKSGLFGHMAVMHGCDACVLSGLAYLAS